MGSTDAYDTTIGIRGHSGHLGIKEYKEEGLSGVFGQVEEATNRGFYLDERCRVGIQGFHCS